MTIRDKVAEAKQYTREELDQYANGAHRSISEHKSRAMLRQCLARIDEQDEQITKYLLINGELEMRNAKLEAEPSEAEVEAVEVAVAEEILLIPNGTTWEEKSERLGKAAIAAFLNARRG